MNSQWPSSISITHVLLVELVLQCLITASAPQLNITTSSSTPCYGDVVTLVCHHPELATNPGRYFSTIPVWRENGEGITPADDTIYSTETVANKSLTFLRVNITVDHFRNKVFNYSCLLALADENGDASGSEKSGDITVDPVDQPPPPVVTTKVMDTSITLTWNTTLLCFESESFVFVVIWSEIGNVTTVSDNTTVSPYNISGLQPNTSYEVSVHGVSGSGVVSKRIVLTVTTAGLSPTLDVPTTRDISTVPPSTIAVAVVVPVVILAMVIIIIVVIIPVLRFKKEKGKSATYQTDEVRIQRSRELEEYSPGSRQTSPKAETRTNYAELTFEGVRPHKPPPLECEVTYTEALAPGERIHQVMVKEPVPELPPKRQDPKLGKEFRADVANVLTKLGVHALVCREIKNVPFLTGDYNGVHFVAYCVHTLSDVSAEDVRRTVEAKQVTGTTKGLLVANQDTIPSDCLLDLDKGGCEFVPVSCYGDEGWGNRMADKFQGFFPLVAASDDVGEEPATPVQEITPCNKYLALRSPSPFDYQSLTERVEDEVDVIDSREETPLLESFEHALYRDEATPEDQSTHHVSAFPSGDHLPTQPPADPFRSVPDAENDVDESVSLSQSSSDSGFTFTFDPTINDGHEEEGLVLPQEYNQLATPVETSDPAHDSLDPLPSPANTVCVSEEVTRSLPTPVQDTTPPPCGGYVLFVMLGHGSIESKSTKKPFVSRRKRSCEAGEYAVLSTLLPPPEHTTSVLQDTLSCGSFWSTPHVKLDEINNNGTIVPGTQCTPEEESSEFLKTMNNHVLNFFGAFAALLAQEATAQLSLSTTGGVQCYGEWVTLLCTHPVLPQNPRFCQPEVDWRGNRRRISAVGLGRTNTTSTTTQLQFIITDRTVGDYTCLLVICIRRASHRIIESNREIVRPLGSPVVTMATTDSSTALTWNTTLHCFESEIFDFVVNWNEIHNSPETSDNWSSYGRLVTGWLKKKSELLTEAWQYEHTFPGELARVPSTAVQYIEKNSHHLQLQSIPYHTNVHWATFLLLTVLHLSGARFIE